MTAHTADLVPARTTRRSYWGAGGVYHFLATGAETGGAYFTFEAIEGPGAGPPPHIHRLEQESFYIVDGRCTFYVGDQVIPATAGDFVTVPRDVVHYFRNESEDLLRMVITLVPAGMEHFFAEVLDPVDDPTAAPPSLSPQMVERMLAAAPKHGLEILAPASDASATLGCGPVESPHQEATAADRFVTDLFQTVDSLDARAFAAAFAEGGSFRFGNAAPAVGRQRIEEHVAGFFSMIGGLRHDIQGVWSGVWEGGDVKSVEATVTYLRADGTATPPIPATSTLRMRAGLIEDFRIFADIAPLFDPKAETT